MVSERFFSSGAKEEMKWKEEREIPVLRKQGEASYLVFPGLESLGVVDHLFSTRAGGVSKGHLSSMNLSFTRGDEEENVRENYRRIANLLNCDVGDFVFSHQTHTSNVRIVTKEDRGKGLVRESDFHDTDGLVTKAEGIVLSAFYADCVPVFLVDPQNRVIGLCHSGWKGTKGRIAAKAIEIMVEIGACKEQIHAAIGPSICGDCYEIDEDLASTFLAEFSDGRESILKRKEGGKYLLDLWKTNERVLLEAGIRQENIEVTGLCTCCNPKYLFSHRASKGRRGNMGAFIMLKKS